MKEIREPSRLTPVIAETDVLVVGSGPGGLAAAVSSARAGVPTMLVERYGCLGGNLTHVGVEGIAWYRQEKTVDVEGIGIEFEKRAKNFGGTAPEPQSLSHAINAEMFKIVADGWVQEAGVEILLHALAVGVICDGDGLKGIVIESKSGSRGYSGQARHRCHWRCRHRRALRRPIQQDPEGGHAAGDGDVLLLRRPSGPLP